MFLALMLWISGRISQFSIAVTLILLVMSSITSSGESEDLKLSLCIICQEIRNEELVVKPTSYERILACIQEWASYGVLNYFESW